MSHSTAATALVPLVPEIFPGSEVPAAVFEYWQGPIEEGIPAFVFDDGVTFVSEPLPHTYTFDEDSVGFSVGNDSLDYTDISVIDVDHSGALCGFGEVWMVAGSAPYVGYTETTGPLRRGLGLRRLLVMNFIAEKETGVFLRSAPFGDTSDSAAGVWQKLARLGMAEEFDDYGFRRFRFTQSTLHR